MSVVRPFSVLSKDELGLSKTGRFLSKAESLGVGVFSPLSNIDGRSLSNDKRAKSATLENEGARQGARH